MEILDQPFLGRFTLGENIAALLVIGLFCYWLIQRINAFTAKDDQDPVLKSRLDQLMLDLDLELHGMNRDGTPINSGQRGDPDDVGVQGDEPEEQSQPAQDRSPADRG